MENNTLEAPTDIDFSLIGAQLRTMYEKDEGGYAVLLVPSERTSDNGTFIKDLIDDIKKMTRGVTGSDTTVDMIQLEKIMTETAEESGSTSMRLEDIVIKFQMVYLYIHKKGENFVLEYTFQLQVAIEGLVPETIKPIVGVTDLSVSVWNTDRKEVVDKMALITVDEYLGAAILLDRSQTAK